MAAILNTVILNSALLDSAILHKTLTQTNWIWLKLIHSHSTWRCQPFWILPLGFSHFEQKKFTHSFSLNLRMAAIFNSTILDSGILHKNSDFKLIHSDSTWWCTDILNFAMLVSATAILDSDTLLSSLRFTQKHSHSTLTLTQTNSIWLKLIHSHLTWWWQPSWILLSWIWPFWIQPS